MSIKKQDPSSITIDMPEVSDIPGQEHIKPIPLRGLSDTTTSSDDEEGKGILDDLNKPHAADDLNKREDSDEIITADIDGETDSDVRPDEKALLENMDEIESGTDDDFIKESSLDETDEDGTPLNESSLDQDVMGEDMDIPESTDDGSDED